MEIMCFQSQWFQLKNGTPVLVFQKIWIEVNVLKTFETFTDCHIKTCRSLKRRAILKIPSTLSLFASIDKRIEVAGEILDKYKLRKSKETDQNIALFVGVNGY